MIIDTKAVEVQVVGAPSDFPEIERATIDKLAAQGEHVKTPEPAARPKKQLTSEERSKRRARRKARNPSRADRWADAASRARSALEELESLREEYEQWRDNLPENLQGSTLGEKLNEVADMEFQDMISVLEDAEGLDLPKGFGRD
jgi:hypothetical protein